MRSVSGGLIAWPASRSSVLITTAATVCCMIALAISLGLLGVFNPTSGIPTHYSIIASAAAHALLGFVITLALWVIGAGFVRLFPGMARESFAAVALLGYVACLPLSAIAIAGLLIAPHVGLVLVLGLVIASITGFATKPFAAADLNRAALAVVAVLPAAVMLGVWFGIDLHGPTSSQTGAPFGDLTFYAGMIWALEGFFTTLPNLGVLGETYSTYFNMLWPAFGAVAVRVIDIDPFLFLLSAGGSAYVLNLCLALTFFLDGGKREAMGRAALPLVMIAAVVAVATPSWTVGSPPMIHALPLAIAVAFWCVVQPFTVVRALVLAALALTGALLSKVTLAVLMVPLTLASIAQRQSRLTRPQLAVLIGIIAVFGLIGLALCLHFLPIYLAIGNIGLESVLRIRDFGSLGTPGLMFTARELGLVLTMALCGILLPWTTSVPLLVGGLIGLVYPWLFRVDFIVVQCLGALLLIQAGKTQNRLVWLAVLILGLMALPAGLLTEPAKGYLWIVWPATMAAVVCVAWFAGPRASSLSRERALLSTVGGASLIVFGSVLLAVASGQLAVADRKRIEASELTPAVHDIWATVRQRTPKTALIFTDQVSEGFGLLEGWNTYAFQGQRQLFLSTWIASNILRTDAPGRTKALAINRAVLAGSLHPADVPETSRFSGFYAVVRASAARPANWTLIHANGEHGLYMIPPR